MFNANVIFDSYFSLRGVFLVLFVIIVLTTIVVIIHDRRDPVKALAWILVVTLIPILGVVIYIFFGRNHRKDKIFNVKEINDLKHIEALCREQLRDLVDPELRLARSITANKDIITLLLNNNRALVTEHNRVKILNGGEAKFSDLFEAIQNAESFVHLEYYIFMFDQVGSRLVDMLIERAEAGVEVRVIYDDVGSWSLKRKHVRQMRQAGIEVRAFMPVAFPWFTSKANYRNHRKIAVIDGKVAYTGGINVADRYIRGTKFGPWRDTHLRIEGEAVSMLHTIFVADWYFVCNKTLLSDAKYFPKTHVRNISPVQIASSGPDSDWASIMQAFFAAINKANKSIYISTPYFTPNQAILTALKVAALSGVDVKIILPYRSDSRMVYWATRSYICELLDAGINVYFYLKGFNHSKFMIIDDNFCSVGSANMDYRSFEDNFEVSAILYDPRVARELTEYFMQDIGDSRQVTQELWAQRSNLHAAYEALARLFSPLL